MENLKSLKEMTPEELNEYMIEKVALDRMEEQKLKKLEEEEDEEIGFSRDELEYEDIGGDGDID